MTKHTSPAAPASHLMTIEEAAEQLRVSPDYIRRRLIFEKRIPYVKVGRYVRIEASALEDLINGGRVLASVGAPTSAGRSIRDIREERLASWRTSESTL